ncbi:MAG: hypothetical protein P1V35_13630 [Planctomycetota bacterium]|nr:hypothetical protein [Planctomycetota bacterium]
MGIRLVALWLLGAALVLTIGSCGGGDDSFKPVNKTGALDGSAPDVILFLLRNSEALEGKLQERPVDMGPVSSGVTFSAAYLRSPVDLAALGDLHWLGRELTGEDKQIDLVDSPFFQAMEQGGYTTEIFNGIEPLADYLNMESAGPRMALFHTWSAEDWVLAEKAVRAKEAESGRSMLSVWTALTNEESPESITEQQLRIPLIFSLPGTLPQAQSHTQVVSLADVGPTILDLCGLIPEGTEFHDHEGASFARVLQKKPLVWRGFVLAKSASGAGWIRSTRWRLIRQDDGSQLLTHVEKVPASTKDDSGLPGANAQLEGLGGRLDAWLK